MTYGSIIGTNVMALTPAGGGWVPALAKAQFGHFAPIRPAIIPRMGPGRCLLLAASMPLSWCCHHLLRLLRHGAFRHKMYRHITPVGLGRTHTKRKVVLPAKADNAQRRRDMQGLVLS